MMAMFCVVLAIVLGLLGGRHSSVLALLIASPILWAVCAVALALGGRPPGQSCLYALTPMAAAQIAFFAGAQMRIDACSTRPAGDDRPAPEEVPEPGGRSAPEPGGR